VSAHDTPRPADIPCTFTPPERDAIVRDAAYELRRPVSDILEDDCEGDPAYVSQRGLTPTIPLHRVRPAMPVHSVVLDSDPMVGPGEVQAPEVTVPVDEFVLQLRRRQVAVDHGQSRFAFHRRLRARIRQRDQVSDLDYPASPGLLDSCSPDIGPAALAAAQRCVERR
jgi:hypothetical protein